MREKFKTCTYDSLNFAALDFFIQKIIMSFFSILYLLRILKFFAPKAMTFRRLWMQGRVITPKINSMHLYISQERGKTIFLRRLLLRPPFSLFSPFPLQCAEIGKKQHFPQGAGMVVLVGRCSSMYERSCSTLCVMSCSLG